MQVEVYVATGYNYDICLHMFTLLFPKNVQHVGSVRKKQMCKGRKCLFVQSRVINTIIVTYVWHTSRFYTDFEHYKSDISTTKSQFKDLFLKKAAQFEAESFAPNRGKKTPN